MSKVTSKLQLTLPKALAERFAIRPGDEIDWQAGPDAIRLVPARRRSPALDAGARLKLFDRATERQRRRDSARGQSQAPRGARSRGWTRDELYHRGRAR